jgi:hypothetical protein
MCIINAASERDMAVFASGMIQACFVAPSLSNFLIISNSCQVYDSMQGLPLLYFLQKMYMIA